MLIGNVLRRAPCPSMPLHAAADADLETGTLFDREPTKYGLQDTSPTPLARHHAQAAGQRRASSSALPTAKGSDPPSSSGGGSRLDVQVVGATSNYDDFITGFLTWVAQVCVCVCGVAPCTSVRLLPVPCCCVLFRTIPQEVRSVYTLSLPNSGKAAIPPAAGESRLAATADRGGARRGGVGARAAPGRLPLGCQGPPGAADARGHRPAAKRGG